MWVTVKPVWTIHWTALTRVEQVGLVVNAAQSYSNLHDMWTVLEQLELRGFIMWKQETVKCSVVTSDGYI